MYQRRAKPSYNRNGFLSANPMRARSQAQPHEAGGKREDSPAHQIFCVLFFLLDCISLPSSTRFSRGMPSENRISP